MLTYPGMVIQMERRFILEPQREGTQAAKAKGVYKGGTRRLSREKVLAIEAKGHEPAAIAKALGCSRMQVSWISGSEAAVTSD